MKHRVTTWKQTKSFIIKVSWIIHWIWISVRYECFLCLTNAQLRTLRIKTRLKRKKLQIALHCKPAYPWFCIVLLGSLWKIKVNTYLWRTTPLLYAFSIFMYVTTDVTYITIIHMRIQSKKINDLLYNFGAKCYFNIFIWIVSVCHCLSSFIFYIYSIQQGIFVSEGMTSTTT